VRVVQLADAGSDIRGVHHAAAEHAPEPALVTVVHVDHVELVQRGLERRGDGGEAKDIAVHERVVREGVQLRPVFERVDAHRRGRADHVGVEAVAAAEVLRSFQRRLVELAAAELVDALVLWFCASSRTHLHFCSPESPL